MSDRTCAFETTRLAVQPWHTAPLPGDADLAKVLTGLLTESTTASLPPAWQGIYDQTRAERWIAERDGESPTLLVSEQATGEPVGLLVIFEIEADGDPDHVDVRVGYLFGESAWGQGYTSELVGGFVNWCRSDPAIRSISGGVSLDNPASARVLTKNRFTPVGDPERGEQIYELSPIA